MDTVPKIKVALIHVKVIDAADPPLGIMYIASFLKSRGFDVRIWDEYKNSLFLKEVEKFQPDLIGISLLSSQLAFVKTLLPVLRQTTKALLTIGGIHPTVLPEATLKETGADAIVMGEGELTMLDLAQRCKDNSWRNIPGIAYLDNGQLVQTPKRDLIPDLDVLPFPDYGMLKLDKVFIPPGTIRGHFLSATAHISTSRGCPNRCIYCNCPTIFGNRVRQRSVENVVAEIRELKRRFPVVEGVWFVDDTFTTYPDWVIRFCDAMIKEGLAGLKWSCQTRVSHVRSDMLKKMKEAGCVQVEYGIESGCDRVLKVLGKNTNVEMIRKAVHLAKEAGLDVFGTFMIGNPTETVQEMEQSFAFAKSLPLDGCRFFFTTPFPGTKLYDMAVENNWLSPHYSFSENLSLRQTNPGETTDEPLMAATIPGKELSKLRAKFQNHFVFRNYGVYAKQWPLILGMSGALLCRPKMFFDAVKYTFKSGRLDTFIEYLVLAWRMKRLGAEEKRATNG